MAVQRPGNSRALVCVAGSRPNSGGAPDHRASGPRIGGKEAKHHDQAHDDRRRIRSPSRCRTGGRSCGGTSVGIIALLNTVANSTPMVATAKAISSGTTMSGSPGLAEPEQRCADHQRRAEAPRSRACAGPPHRRSRRAPATASRSRGRRPRSQNPTSPAPRPVRARYRSRNRVRTQRS